MKRVTVKTPTLALNVYALVQRAIAEGLEFVWTCDAMVRRFEQAKPFPEPRVVGDELNDKAVCEWYAESEALDVSAAESSADAVLEKLCEFTDLRELPLGAQKRVREALIGYCRYGWMRAHKHVDQPNAAAVRDEMERAMELDEIFKWG